MVSVTLAVCLVVPITAIGQSSERKPSSAAKEQAAKGAKPGDQDKSQRSRPAQPDAREKRDKKSGDERIRLDAPVSFPVDI